MAITLSVVDNGDDTGAVATLSGGGAGATNTVYTSAFNGELGSGESWVESGSRTGNGTVDLDLAAGHYLAYVLSNASGTLTVSTVVYFVVTTGADALLYRCKVAAQARIRLLTLSGVHSDNVLVRKLPFERVMPRPLPAVIVSNGPSISQPPRAGTNLRDDLGYPVLITFLSADNQDLVANDSRNLLWAELVNKAFRHQRLTGVSEIYNCLVEPGPITTPAWWLQNVWHSSLTLRFISREARGF